MVSLVQMQGRRSLPGEPQPVPGCVDAVFMPVALWYGCQACFWVERSRKNCTKGNRWEGHASSAGSLPPRQDQGVAQAPRFPGKYHIFSSASSSGRKCQVPAVGVSVASRHFPFRPLCLAVEAVWKVPSSSPQSQPRDTQCFSCLPHIPPSCLPLRLRVGHSADSACSPASGSLPKQPHPHLSFEVKNS